MTAARNGDSRRAARAPRARRARGRPRSRVSADGADDRGAREPCGGGRSPDQPGAAVNAQTRKGPTPKFVPPCKGTGCGSEGVGINRGGLPDRGRRAEAQRRHDAAAVCRAGRPAGRRADAGGRRRRHRAGRRERDPAAADGRPQQQSGRRAAAARARRGCECRRLLGPVAALGGGRVSQPRHEQPRPGQPDRQRRRSRADSRVHPGAARRRRQRERPDAGSAPEPALALLAGRRLVGRLHRSDAVSEGRAVRRHRHDAPAARVRRRSEPADAGRHDAADGGGRRQLGGRADLHRVAAGAPRCGQALSGARRRRERDQFDGTDGAARSRQPRLERHHRAAGRPRRATRRQGSRKDGRRSAGRRASFSRPSARSASRRPSPCSNN